MRIQVLFLTGALLLAVGGAAFAAEADSAREDPSYKAVSPEPLSAREKSVTYSYTDEGLPCGTLMTQYTKKGSAALGRGGVGKLADAACLKEGANYIPDNSSARTYACENFSKNGLIIARATFAFSCTNDPDALEQRKQEDITMRQPPLPPQPAIPDGPPPEPSLMDSAIQNAKDDAAATGAAISKNAAKAGEIVKRAVDGPPPPSPETNAYFKAAENGDMRAKCWILEGYIKQPPCYFEEPDKRTPQDFREERHLTPEQIEAEKKWAKQLDEIRPNCMLTCD